MLTLSKLFNERNIRVLDEDAIEYINLHWFVGEALKREEFEHLYQFLGLFKPDMVSDINLISFLRP